MSSRLLHAKPTRDVRSGGNGTRHSGGFEGKATRGSGGGKRRGGAAVAASGKLRAALVLHGKLGGIDRGQGWTRAVDGAEPTIDLAVICYAGATRHIVEANRAEAAIDIFGHSWSPEIGQALDALWQPRASVHEAEPRARNRQLCLTVGKMLHDATSDGSGVHGAPFAGFGGVGRGANSCERTANHLLGIQRAIQLKAKHEGRHGFKYDVVLVSRWDVLWSRPLILSRLDLSQHAFTVPTFCTHARGVDRQSDVEKQLSAFRKLACGGESSAGQLPTAATACHPSHRPCQPDLSPRAREFYLLDWWFASDSTAADDFGTVADEKLYANYTLLNQEHLNSARNSRPTIMGHAYWGLHMVCGAQRALDDFTALPWATSQRCPGRLHSAALDDFTALPWAASQRCPG
jgi:hypothetical protein